MRIGIDVTPLLRERSGIAVCTEMLLQSALGNGHEVVGLVSGWRQLHDGPLELGIPVVRSWVPRTLNPFFMDVLRWPKLETLFGRLDVFVATNFAILPARRATNIALLHDVGRLVHPHLYGRRQVIRSRFMVRRCARFADILMVPTESVAHEVVQLGLAGWDRIRVVPWFARPLPESETGGLDGVPSDRPLMLCVATHERRKNIPLLIRAFRRAAEEVPHRLVVAGGSGPDSEEVLATARSNGASDRIHFVGHANPAQLAALYRRADLAVCPSRYEGFGLTLLEAMASGCPVLAADIPAHREVGGDAVRLVPPTDEGAFAAGLVELACNDVVRTELRDLGLRRSRHFSTGETRRQFDDLLSSLCVP
ncbi:MAG: glycosyltransferase family 4 protein [Planctomycetota bacterium]